MKLLIKTVKQLNKSQNNFERSGGRKMTYYCTIRQEGNEYIAQFPDMPNVVTCGFSQEEALAMAKEALDGILELDIEGAITIPKPIFKEGFPVTVALNISLALQLRKLRGSLTQNEIASRLGLSYQAYQRLENPRKSNPTIKTVEKIAKAFGCKADLAFA